MTRERRLERLLSHLPETPRNAAQQIEACGGVKALTEEAGRSGLLPLLAHYLPEQFSLPSTEAIQAKFLATRLQKATVKAVSTLHQETIESVVLKGAGLATQLYPEPWLRPSSDVDLLVRASDADRARAALEKIGWRMVSDPRARPLNYQHSINFINTYKQALELHYTLSSQFQAQLDLEVLFAHSRPIAVAGQRVWVFDRIDELIHLCVHAAAHTFVGVKWLFDIKLLIGKAGFAWRDVVNSARRLEVTSAVGIALLEAQQRLKAAVPREVIDAMQPGKVRRFLVRAADRVPIKLTRTRTYALDMLLADKLSTGWALRIAAPIVKRAPFINRRINRGQN